MASKRKLASTASLPALYSSSQVLHEGWCVKESGNSFFGKTNWRRRWFKLVQKGSIVKLEYYRNVADRTPAGSVALDVTYSTRQLESHEKPYPNCFAVGPLVDDGATRTYYISCSNGLVMQEWMTVIDAVIQGVPEEAQKRRRTITHHYSRRAAVATRPPKSDSSMEASVEESGKGMSYSSSSGELLASARRGGAAAYVVTDSLEREEVTDEELCADVDLSDDEDDVDHKGAVGGARDQKRTSYECPDSKLSPSARVRLYFNNSWRMEHWRELCILNRTLKWIRPETKDGVTVTRCKFGKDRRGYAMMKVEGVLESDPDTVYNFIKISTREGGKLDYIFRNETLLEQIEEEPQATVIFNQFLLPLPRVSARDVVALKTWVPQCITTDNSCGMVMFSVDHPQSPPEAKDSLRINVDTSGLILTPFPGPEGMVYTRAVILVRVALYGALHRMLKGAYNSGLFKLGMRTTFQHMQEQLMRFVDLTNI